MKLHSYFFYFPHYNDLFPLDFVSQVPLHRIPHCVTTRSSKINNKSI